MASISKTETQNKSSAHQLMKKQKISQFIKTE